MRRHDQLSGALFAGGRKGLHVTAESSLEGLRRRPFRMLRRERLDAIEGEGELGVDRVFDPERPVIVERGNPRIGRNELRAAPVVTLATKLTIACLAAPSFQDGRGSAACAEADIERSRPKRTGNAANAETSERRLSVVET